MKLNWHSYRQTNSRGEFRGPALNVHIQALSPTAADAIAMERGLYFDGIDKGIDCSCCGDRWQRADARDGSADEPVETPDAWDISCAKRANGVLALWIRADGAERAETVL